MKKLIYLLLISAAMVSCKEDKCAFPSVKVDEAQLEIDIATIDDYLASNQIEAMVDASGIRYQIIDAGNTNKVIDYCSTVYVQYTGTLLNGTVFDQTFGNDFSALPIERLISGWAYGLKRIKEGGEIILYIPSVYAYGSVAKEDANGVETIPANSNLIFSINLLYIKNQIR